MSFRFKKIICANKSSGGVSMVDGYHKITGTHREAAALMAPLFYPTIDAAAEQGIRRVIIGDLGCADGANALAWISKVVEYASQKGVKIHIAYSDYSGNNEARVHEALAGKFPTGATYSYEDGSFLTKVYEDESLHVSATSTAIHWLSQNVSGGGHIYATRGKYRDKFLEIAERDLRDFYEARATELKPGGKLVISNIAEHSNGDYIAKHILNLMQDIAVEMEINDLTFQYYFRTRQELEAPIREAKPDSEAATLSIVSSKEVTVDCAYFKAYLDKCEGEGNSAGGDAERRKNFGEAMANSCKAWAYSSVCDAVGREKADEFFKQLALRCAEDPAKYHMDFLIVQLVAQKANQI